MTKEIYEQITALLRKYPHVVAGMIGINKALSGLCYVMYPLLVGYLYLMKDERLLRCILVPAISFAAVSVFRKIYNAPRPYEKGFDTLMKKHRKGQSFPSRHVFSAFMIAMTYAYILPNAAPALFFVGVLLAVIRVLGGVHFPKDVLVGAICAIAAGILGFWVIP